MQEVYSRRFRTFWGRRLCTGKIYIHVSGNSEKELGGNWGSAVLQCCSVAVGKRKESREKVNKAEAKVEVKEKVKV
jgi:hypothetical protein